MVPKIVDQKIIITGTKKLKHSCFNKLAFVFALMFSLCIFQLNIGFAQTTSKNIQEKKSNQDPAKDNTLTNKTNDPNTENAVVIKTDNSSTIDPKEEIIRRKAMTMIMNSSKSSNPLTSTQSASSSSFILFEQKQKDRKKSKLEMQSYNHRNNKKIKENFQRFQKKRYKQINYTGKHYDYTSYNQNFQENSSR